MLHSLGHHVIHYGNEQSEVDCDEHVTVTTFDDLIKHYGKNHGHVGDYKYDVTDPVYLKFYINSIAAITERKQPNDFLLCMFGRGHKPVADAHPDLIAVEPGIGYSGTFARWKVFESYAMLHAWHGLKPVDTALLCDWYAVVIPNYFDPKDFDYKEHKNDYLLFLGRPGEAKGLHVAAEIAKLSNKRLVVAGPSTPDKMPEGVDFVGFASWEKRRGLLANAQALIAPSQFIEPFCGVLIEAAFSGTPVITIDWGGPTEIVLHGLTGYRCRTMDHWLWAVANIEQIKPQTCRDWAMANFTMVRVRHMYEEYFRMITDIHGHLGWYELHPERANLDWLRREYPSDLFYMREDERGNGSCAQATVVPETKEQIQ